MRHLFAELHPPPTPGSPLLLPYCLCRVPKTQVRFRRRLLLEPQIDLKRYKAKAEIDWIEVVVALDGSKTQGRYVHERMSPLRGHVNRWEGGKKVKGYTGHTFVCRIQNPRYEKVLEFLGRLKMWKGLASEAEVVGMELSLDWYPKSQAAEERLKMVGLLRRHFLPPELIDPERRTQRKHAQPRSFIRFGPKEESRGITEYVYEKTLTKRNSKEIRSHRDKGKPVPVPPTGYPEVDAEYQSPRIDGTFYVGAKWDDSYWSIQNKTTDERTGGDARNLPPSECRARIEVTLQRAPLRDLGLVSLEDVRTFNFDQFAKPFFRFWMATVPMNLEEAAADQLRRSLHRRNNRRQYLKDVLAAGVYAAHREDCREALSKRGANVTLPIGQRVKDNGRSKTYPLGENSYLMSYDDMNRKTRDALKWLEF